MTPEAPSCSVFRGKSPGTHSPACSPGQGHTDLQRANGEDQALCLRAALPPGRTSRGLGGMGQQRNDEKQQGPTQRHSPRQVEPLARIQTDELQSSSGEKTCRGDQLRGRRVAQHSRRWRRAGRLLQQGNPRGWRELPAAPWEQLTRLGQASSSCLPPSRTKAERVRQAAFMAAASGRVGSALPVTVFCSGSL